MKFKYILALVFLVFLKTYASAQGTINNFTLMSGFEIVQGSSETKIRATARIMRGAMPGNSWTNVNMKLKIGVSASPGGALIELLSPEYSVVSTDFESGYGSTDVYMEFNVATSKLIVGQYLVLAYYNVGYGSAYVNSGVRSGQIRNYVDTGYGPPYWWQRYIPYTNSKALQRLVRTSPGKHFMAETKEALNLTGAVGQNWRYEGTLGYLRNVQEPGTVPLYRYYRHQVQDHYFSIYVTSPPSGYVSEGVVGYAYNSPGPGRVPVYAYAKKTGSTDRLYTTNFNELGSGNSTWLYEGIGFYILN